MASRTYGLTYRCTCASTSAPSARLFSSTTRRWDGERRGRDHHQAGSQTSAAPQGGAQSALNDLSSSIEQLSAKNAQRGTASVFNPRATTSSVRDRQAVSGRAFLNGHYYNPQTLSYDSITAKPKPLARPILGPPKKEAVQQDLLHIYSLNPGKPSLHDDSYKNAPIIANFMSEMGKILPRAQTGLTRKSQRSIGKAIRRARAIGLLPVLSRGGSRFGGAGWK